MAKKKRRNPFIPKGDPQSWFARGEPLLWFNASGVTLSLLLVGALLYLLTANGLAHFWPKPLYSLSVAATGTDGSENESEPTKRLYVERVRTEVSTHATGEQRSTLFRRGNRDRGDGEFVWVNDENVVSLSRPAELVRVLREAWGPAYGELQSLETPRGTVALSPDADQALYEALDRIDAVRSKMAALENGTIRKLNREAQRLYQRERAIGGDAPLAEELGKEQARLSAAFTGAQRDMLEMAQSIEPYWLTLRVDSGELWRLPLASVLAVQHPNSMSYVEKLESWALQLWAFLSTAPRESNTEGGVFPAIVGTVVMVLLMSVIVAPFGVLAAIYLHEYAKQDWKTRLIRIGVNNLAGVPSIVYGVFGLGFLVYVVGGELDKLFYSDALPSPTFGAPGLLWASITLALLTLPVVIVATEEGLARIPQSLRDGSLALGATRFETLWRIIVPIATPAMMTGVILAIARAAGEVAPLMLVGVVKLAPALPIDSHYPYLHLDQKFMHLGYHVFDVGFQSANIEAARPLVYATALLLVVLTIGLNLFAVLLRNHLREKYKAL
ncbi:phosphate ABC transporter permease PstA [Parahalioglobus pacificus]|uniref:Phosphate transport system permease protein PstA n=1 Tax=Parahalioglobus pacificus TaxID=930806 RepID=A0A918XFI0_9GAMM|nr:phosphate ABC transporter permease PstA [Halioglobus pacificus]GHD29035.1 phosphate transport system permease protein PstA [Halioglobus pacificus]